MGIGFSGALMSILRPNTAKSENAYKLLSFESYLACVQNAYNAYNFRYKFLLPATRLYAKMVQNQPSPLPLIEGGDACG